MERLLIDIKHLLVVVAVVLIYIGFCQGLLVFEKVRPSRAEAKSEGIMKVDLVKVGSYYISKWEFLGGKK